jgi:hypothetical protein
MGNNKDWDDIPYVTGDCIRDTDEWNDMIDYIRHSSCTDFTIYETCPKTGQAFRLTKNGAISQMFGGDDSGDDLLIYVNETDQLYMALRNTGEFELFDGATQFLGVELNGTVTEIIGGVLSTDDISIQPNSAVGAPKLTMYGNSYSYYDIPTGSKFYWRSGFTTFLELFESGTDDTIASATANNDFYLQTNGTGVLKWGTEVTNAGSDRGELIKMKTAAGTVVYLKTYDLV